MTNNNYQKYTTKFINEGKKTYIVNSFTNEESKKTLANVLYSLMLRELEKDK